MKDSLVMSHVVFRHGNKYLEAATKYPNDPHANIDTYPFKIGDLTLDGKRNSFKLGKDLRQLYSKFLGETYYSGIVDATTAGTSRNEMTLLCVLASLFPTNSKNQLDDETSWQPVLYKKLNLETDEFLSIYGVYAKTLFSQKIIDVDEETSKIFDYLEKNMGTSIGNCPYTIYLMLKLQEELNLRLPEWAKPIWPEPLTKLALYWYRAFINKFHKLYLENFVGKLIADTRETISTSAKHKTKLFLYSGHDTNVTTLLKLIDFPDFLEEVHYCACIILEVHLINGEYGFKVLYRNNMNGEFRYLRMFDIGEFIPLDKFEELFQAKMRL